MDQNYKDKIEEKVEEYLKCKDDFNYFCGKYILIELPGGDVHLKPYKRQKELIDELNKEKFLLVLKSRQIGISTIIQAYSAWLSNFYDNTVIGIISKDGKEATDFARAIRGMIEKLPIWLRPRSSNIQESFDKKTEQSFILSNGSKIYAATVNPNAPNKTLRGKAITFLIIDEAAFIAKLDDAWTGMVPALATSQKHARLNNVPYGTVILSTPNKTIGVGSWFYSRYSRSVNKEGIFKPFIIHWKQIPELANDKSWYKTQCEMFDNDPRKIEQELELKFLPTSGSFFDEKTCVFLQQNTENIKPIETFMIFDGEVWKFQEPIPGKYYIIGVDTAPEFGDDKSTITVFDYETLDQVWEYQTKCKVLDFVKVVKYVCSQYPGLIVIENNSYGNQVMEEINNSEYTVMMYKEKRGENKIVPGLSNNSKTRPLMIDALYSYVNQYPEMIKSKRLALELIGLVNNKNGKVEAESGCHDDLALSMSMAMYVRKYDPPLMIDSSKGVQDVFMDIINMNIDKKEGLDNSEIMRYVKDNVKTNDDMLVDTLKLYYRG